MRERLKRLLGWLCGLFLPAAKQAAPDIVARNPNSCTLPWIVPLCRSWPVPRHGKTGAAAIKRAARKHRNRRMARHV